MKKTIKAWAAIIKPELIGESQPILEAITPLPFPSPLAIYYDKKDATYKPHPDQHVVPCTITYEI